VTIYNSKKGNSGAFAVISFSGTTVTVDASDLPLGSFITETSGLYAAIIRPVHFTAWDTESPPIFNTPYQTFYSNDESVIMVSHIHSISGDGYEVWPAFELDSPSLNNTDYIVFDHLDIENAACGIFTEGTDMRCYYCIIQHCHIHDFGYIGGASDEGIYWGRDTSSSVPGHNYCQIMYNIIGPHGISGLGEDDGGDGIEIKETARYATVFGNEVFEIEGDYFSAAPIRTSGADSFVANNYIHDIAPERRGCGIAVVDDYPATPNIGGKRAVVINNILADVRGVGIIDLDSTEVQILNNTIYNITYPEPGGDPDWYEEYAGILVWNYQGTIENLVIKNNIVHSSYIGIGRYIWSGNYEFSADSDYNICHNCTYPFRGEITQNAHDLTSDPKFVDANSENFHIQSDSPARDAGATLADVAIDYDYLLRPQGAAYDRGAYEYESGGGSEKIILRWRQLGN
jgi:hypothetical protein